MYRRNKTTAILSLLLVCTMLISTTGCSGSIQAKNLTKTVHTKRVEGVTDLTTDSVKTTDFAVRLFQHSVEEGENTLISPLSALYALAMTANGANGETLTQMEEVLGMPTDDLNNYLYSYMQELPQNRKYKLNLANSIWFTDAADFDVNEDFLQTAASYYDAEIYQAPFDSRTLKDINNWVKKETDKMIPEILDEIPDLTVMYLINALAFEAEWEKIYKENHVRDDIFTLEDGTEKTATYMSGTEGHYLQDDYATGFIKYYKDSKYAFVALLPNEDTSVSDYITTLDGEHLQTLLSNPEQVSTAVALPKFEVEYDVTMNDILINMGMPDAFSDFANFSKLGSYGKGPIYINRVLHKTFISVAEKGTKAGAATAVEMRSKGASANFSTKEVILNRPFVYMLIDCETHFPFFIGSMMDISAK